jgi:ABC-type phosphate transport system permease subunit
MASQQKPVRIEDLQVAAGRARTQRILRRLFFMSAALAILITVGIIWALLSDSIYFLTHVTIEQLFDGAWLPRSNRYDIPTLLLGTTPSTPRLGCAASSSRSSRSSRPSPAWSWGSSP